MGSVTALPGGTLPAANILDGETARNLKFAIVIGLSPDDSLFLSSTSGDLQKIHFLLAKVAHKILEGDYNQ